MRRRDIERDLTVPVPHPVYCVHGITVAWRYTKNDRIDTRMAGWCPACGPIPAPAE